MKNEIQMERYAVITEKRPREIVLLRGSGCAWRRCTFCDYHLDYSKNQQENFELNAKELDKVTGKYHDLEVVNSGSVFELDIQTIEKIMEICREKNIAKIHFESHWMYKDKIMAMKKKFYDAGIKLNFKTGVESFDYEFRENILKKGIDTNDVNEIAQYFDEVCLLQGLSGQTVESMKKDIEMGLAHFDSVCINIMIENTTKVKPDQTVISDFMQYIFPLYEKNNRVDILLNNTDFGVGGEKDAQ